MQDPEKKVIVFKPGAPEYGDGYPFVSTEKPETKSKKEEPRVKSDEEIDFDNQIYIE